MATPGAGGPGPPRFTFLDLLLLVALAILWGSAYDLIRVGLELGASPILYACVRYLLSSVVFVLLALGRGEPTPRRAPALWSALLGGILVIGLYGAFLYWGEQYTTGGYASVLSSSAPILTVVVAYGLLPSERFGPMSLLGVALGFAGVVVLVLPELGGSAGSSWAGPAFVLAAFVSTVVGSVLLRRVGGGRQGLWQLGLQFAVGGGLLAAASVALPTPERLPLTPPVLSLLGALVVFSSVMGYFVYFTLHHRVGPVRANTVAYLLPLVGIGIGSGLLGEPVSIDEVLGFLIVIAGITLVLRDSMRGPRAAAPG